MRWPSRILGSRELPRRKTQGRNGTHWTNPLLLAKELVPGRERRTEDHRGGLCPAGTEWADEKRRKLYVL